MALTAELKYLQWQDLYERERPFQLFIDLPPDAEDRRVSNLVFEKHHVPIVDIRSRYNQFSLDTHGFMIRKHQTAMKDFTDREAVESIYLPEVEEILRSNLDGVDGCFVFNWRLRNTDPEVPGQIDLNDPTDFRRPATHLHIEGDTKIKAQLLF
ncbi:hypothetical protein QQX98_013360 [Neonectria punicea]|uniref:Uncharacterized protein n=1 Tax=Neonectria punicea TaxID=979145 RepID=A0ABR1GGJ0_9HYPO